MQELEASKKSKEYEEQAALRREAERKQQLLEARTKGRAGTGAATGETYEWYCVACKWEYIEPDVNKLVHGTYAVGHCWKCGNKLQSRTDRQKMLHDKVKELSHAREARAERRQQFERYKAMKAKRSAAAPAPAASTSSAGASEIVTAGAAAATQKSAASSKPARVTDYDAWDFWEPDSDDGNSGPITCLCICDLIESFCDVV